MGATIYTQGDVSQKAHSKVCLEWIITSAWKLNCFGKTLCQTHLWKEVKWNKTKVCSTFLVGVTGYSLASQALPACCHLVWHQADNFAPLGYGTIHRIVPLNAPSVCGTRFWLFAFAQTKSTTAQLCVFAVSSTGCAHTRFPLRVQVPCMYKKRKEPHLSVWFFLFWCERRDLNPHGLPHAP